MSNQNQNLQQLKQKLFDHCLLRLGSGIIDLEVDPEHCEAAFDFAVSTYRQRAQNATQQTYIQLTIEKTADTYTLPPEIINIRGIYRRSIGLDSTGGGRGNGFDPFSAAVTNTYVLNYQGAGGLATYDFYAQYLELAGRMFGAHVTYFFDPVTKVLKINRNFKASGEKVLIWADMQKDESNLILNPQTGNWIREFTLATLKIIIGEAREKFATIAGPSGGTSLNGAAMKAEGLAMQEKLIDDLRNYADGSTPLTWVIG